MSASTLSREPQAVRVEDDPMFRRAPLFQGVSNDDVAALAASFERVGVPRGTVLFGQGDSGDYLYVILAGRVKLVRRASDGREQLVAVMGPGEQFGELSIFDPGPRLSSAAAVADTQLARVSRDAVTEWAEQRPHIAGQLLRVLARRLRRTNSVMSDLIFIDVPGRLAKQVLLLAGRFGTPAVGGIRVRHGLTQEELAQLVGTSRETVNKTLSTFAGRGWLRLDAKGFIILDPDALARRAR